MSKDGYITLTINWREEERKDKIYFFNTGKKRPPRYINFTLTNHKE